MEQNLEKGTFCKEAAEQIATAEELIVVVEAYCKEKIGDPDFV